MKIHRFSWPSLAAAALVVVVFSAWSAQSNLDLIVTADHTDAIYKEGETVTFTIKLLRDQQPPDDAEVQWTMSKDGVPPLTSGTVRFSGGSAKVTGKLDEPGFLQCRAVLRDSNQATRTAVAGVAVARVNGWPKFLANPPAEPASNVVEAVRYFDAMNFATRARCDGIMTVGFIDTTCPPTSVYAAYNALAGQKQIFNDPPSTHAVSAKAGEAMRAAITAHIEKRHRASGQ